MSPASLVIAPSPPWHAASVCADIQSRLVPPIAYQGGRLEVYGQSIPKDEVGGDLADLAADGRDVVAYVADVSGHGLRAGVLMGMIKTAIRYGLLLGQPLAKLLNDINLVLPALKDSNMFATLAALRFDDSNQVEYLSAGHVPLLHYRRRYGDVVRHSMSQFPLGLFTNAAYASRRIPYEAGDVFALITDGVVEAGEDRDADSGLEQLARILRDSPAHPLSEIVEAMHAEAQRHGPQPDDQTVLLIRAMTESGADARDLAPGPSSDALEVKWRKLLDELAEELAQDEETKS
jgi:serine phosphatase RsbU (regulator of sigma subunit)